MASSVLYDKSDSKLKVIFDLDETMISVKQVEDHIQYDGPTPNLVIPVKQKDGQIFKVFSD
jgi:hypothetical protein